MIDWKIGARVLTPDGAGGVITHLGVSVARIRLDRGGYCRLKVSALRRAGGIVPGSRTPSQASKLAAAMQATGLSEEEIVRRARACDLSLVEACEALLGN